jgi:hypothetical protein
MAKRSTKDTSMLIPSTLPGVGPVEVHEPYGHISWNRFDWPLYIKCRQSVDIPQLARVMQNGLRLDKPQILLSVLSGFGPLSSWTAGPDQLRELAIGLGKTASSARMWLATNGIDMGSSRLFAGALNHARMWQSAVGQEEPQAAGIKFEHVCIGKYSQVVCGHVRSDSTGAFLLLNLKFLPQITHRSKQEWSAKID